MQLSKWMGRLTVLTIALVVAAATACGGVPCDEANDDSCLAVESTEQAVMQAKPIWMSPYVYLKRGGGGMSGVGTSSCSGSETNAWGDETTGGVLHVTCTSWYFAEWNPYGFVSDQGYCTYGVCPNLSYDLWAQ